MTVEVSFTNMPGTKAALGLAGTHAIVADRPVGKAGGQGLGFNGAQLLALSLGGCFCNDLRYVADRKGIDVGEIRIDVALELEGEPLVATSARMRVGCTVSDGSDPAELIAEAKKSCMVSNTLSRAMTVDIQTLG